MNRFVFPLRDLPREEVAPGLRGKAHVSGEQRFRIVEFTTPFEETAWCTKAHAGHVIDGEMIVNVDGDFVTYRTSDVINLQADVRHRHHKTVRTATLFLIENA